jgi:molybdopterin/thiamine biosynthesis adenylyltransferase
VTSGARAALAADRAALRRDLAARGFADDGEVLRGSVMWRTPDGRDATAVADITIPDRYPFGPPVVRLVDPGSPLEITFHHDLDGALCLWDTDEPVTERPWTDVDQLLRRAAGWLENTAAGWPGDEDCDLERYLPTSGEPGIVLYDHDAIRPLQGYLRTSAAQVPGVVTVLASVWSPPARPTKNRAGRGRKAAASPAPRHLAYAADLGPLSFPIRGWDDIAATVGDRARELRGFINQGSVELLLLWYRRGQREAALAVAVQPGRPPTLKSCEAADTSLAARILRAGVAAEELANKSVAIIGCGAVGSHVADLLYRDGIRHLNLADGQLLRPGNVIRHLAPPSLVGLPKAEAVKQILLSYELAGDASDGIRASRSRVETPSQALEILNCSDLVIDATADQRATAMLCWAAAITGRSMVTVCAQREGGIARADRFPLRSDEEHLPPIPETPHLVPVRERGCGDAVSLTPPSTVLVAAELAVELARDELAHSRALPATMLRVLSPQPDLPYATRRTLAAGRGPGLGTAS